MQARRRESPLRDIAADLGVSNVTLSRIERGTYEPSLTTAIALAKWLGLSVEQVLDAARSPAPEKV